MIILFAFGLLLGAVSVIFALQNITVITVSFFSWQLTGSLALILLLAISSGILITLFFLLPEFISSYFKHKSLEEENHKLAEDLRKQKELTVFAKHIPASKEEISKIEHGATIDAPI